MFIAIPIYKNLFEAPPIYQSVINYGKLEEFYSYLTICLESVEILDLNTRIWTKE